MEDNKKRKYMYIAGPLVLLIALVGITYAFFNYTRTGVSNTIKVGKISFSSNQTDTIILTNVFPISSSEATGENTNYDEVVISINGDTTYSEGIEYLITATNVSNTINNKQIPISVEIIPSSGLGNSDLNYFDNRGGNASINKVLSKDTIEENGDILVGYIAKGATGVNGTVTIKAYIDKNNIAISDTYPSGNVTHTESSGEASIEVVDYTNETTTSWVNGRVVLTTSEWNTLQNSSLSFKVKVEANEGIWVEDPRLLTSIIASKLGTTYVKSYNSEVISSNPTYKSQDTVYENNNKLDINYYTGADGKENGNLLFAGYCWQIIRTTDTGGVKLIYNGVAVNDKCETTRTYYKRVNGRSSYYSQNMGNATLYGRSYDYNLKTGEFTIEDSTGLPTSWTVDDNNNNGTPDYQELTGTYTCLSDSNTCTNLYYVGAIDPSYQVSAYVARYDIETTGSLDTIGESVYNTYDYSLAQVGYMYNKEYFLLSESKSGEYYSNLSWSGTSYNLINGNGQNSPDATHHYICDDVDCIKVRYYSSSNKYILLEDGKTIENALKEMINYKTNASDTDENINVYNSAIKGHIDNWYKKNLLSYTSFIDNDVVYCNDRSVKELNGWNPSGTSLSSGIRFYQYFDGRNPDMYTSGNGNTNLSCANMTDRFSVSNEKARLTYPISLLIEPERILMSEVYAKAKNTNYWELSPRYFDGQAHVRRVGGVGDFSSNDVNIQSGVRPVITLKPGTIINGGNGLYESPYIVGPLVTRDES